MITLTLTFEEARAVIITMGYGDREPNPDDEALVNAVLDRLEPAMAEEEE